MGKISIEGFGKDYSVLRNLVNYDGPICIYGCGVNGEIIYDYLKQNGKKIEFFVDRQADAREFYVLGKRVVSPRKFLSKSKKIKILISPDNFQPIVNYLLEQGITNDRIICPFRAIIREIRLLEENYSPEDYIVVNQNIIHDEEPVVTVFTILYNTPKSLLCRTIESVLKQDYVKFEYLIIDNGSDDDSSEIIKKYANNDNRIKYIRLEKNVVWASYEILSILKDHITGSYVAMVDSDDYYEETFLSKAVALIEKDRSDFVQVNTFTYALNGFKYSFYNHYMGEDICLNSNEAKKAFLLRQITTPTWGKLYKFELFTELLEYMWSFRDNDVRDRNFCLDVSWLTFLVLSSKKVSLCDECLHIRTWRPGSSEHSDDHISKWLSSIVWSFKYINQHICDEALITGFKDTLLSWLFSLGRDDYDLGKLRNEDVSDSVVTSFLQRPICDKYRR